MKSWPGCAGGDLEGPGISDDDHYVLFLGEKSGKSTQKPMNSEC